MSDRTDWADQQGAIIVSWAGVTRGREGKAFEVFGKAVQYYGELEKEGVLTGTHVYFNSTGGNRGQIILNGSMGTLHNLLLDAKFSRLQQEASLIADDLQVNSAIGGSFDSISEGMAANLSVLQEHGLI
ncbi:MAG: hypothetical protein QOG03_2668 [Actinomycetota bacterium]|jgi:hypothetical protein|nr:hypothetical protein [Actinomycetota bacterium]